MLKPSKQTNLRVREKKGRKQPRRKLDTTVAVHSPYGLPRGERMQLDIYAKIRSFNACAAISGTMLMVEHTGSVGKVIV